MDYIQDAMNRQRMAMELLTMPSDERATGTPGAAAVRKVLAAAAETVRDGMAARFGISLPELAARFGISLPELAALLGTSLPEPAALLGTSLPEPAALLETSLPELAARFGTSLTELAAPLGISLAEPAVGNEKRTSDSWDAWESAGRQASGRFFGEDETAIRQSAGAMRREEERPGNGLYGQPPFVGEAEEVSADAVPEKRVLSGKGGKDGRLSARELSLEIERDARRYDGGYQMY